MWAVTGDECSWLAGGAGAAAEAAGPGRAPKHLAYSCSRRRGGWGWGEPSASRKRTRRPSLFVYASPAAGVTNAASPAAPLGLTATPGLRGASGKSPGRGGAGRRRPLGDRAEHRGALISRGRGRTVGALDTSRSACGDKFTVRREARPSNGAASNCWAQPAQPAATGFNLENASTDYDSSTDYYCNCKRITITRPRNKV